MAPNRRTVLRGTAIGLAGAVSGCLGELGGTEETTAPSTQNGTSQPTTEAGPSEEGESSEGNEADAETGTTVTETSSEASVCGSGWRRLAVDLPANYELEYGQGFGFEQTASPDTLSIGEDLTIDLVNATDSALTTGPKSQYAIERRTEDGSYGETGSPWRHVLWVPQGFSFPDETVSHEPGDGFTWEFPFTEEGLSQEPFQVCESLQPGEYHFTYFGFPDAKRGLTIGFEVQ